MKKVLTSWKIAIASWVFASIALCFMYLSAFTYVSLGLYRGEEIDTVGFSYVGKTTYGPILLPEGLAFVTESGERLSQEETIKVINSDLRPFIRDGRIYIKPYERSEWRHKVYWAPANAVTTNLAKIVRFLHQKS